MYILAAKTLILCLAFAGAKVYQRKRLEEKLKREQAEKQKREMEKKGNWRSKGIFSLESMMFYNKLKRTLHRLKQCMKGVVKWHDPFYSQVRQKTSSSAPPFLAWRISTLMHLNNSFASSEKLDDLCCWSSYTRPHGLNTQMHKHWFLICSKTEGTLICQLSSVQLPNTLWG